MKKLNLNIRLLLTLCLLLAGTIIADSFFRKQYSLPAKEKMKSAANLSQEWFKLIQDLKNQRGIISSTQTNVPNGYLIGDEWSEITTTLGSLEAKEISTNPDFAALMVRLTHEAGIGNGDKVGIIASGSFPALAISTLAAMQTLETEVVLISSLGASTYGANQPDASWLDMETCLQKTGGLVYRSTLVTLGAGNDNGLGLYKEGLIELQQAAQRNHRELYLPENLQEAIDHKRNLLTRENIKLLINIGGNQTALGACVHSTTIPNGLNFTMNHCMDYDRGLISRMNEMSIPFINILNIKELATQYGMDIAPGIKYSDSTNLYNKTQTKKGIILVLFLLCCIPLMWIKKP